MTHILVKVFRLGATLTTLAKIQADNKNAENEVVKKILGEVDQAVVTLDQFQELQLRLQVT